MSRRALLFSLSLASCATTSDAGPPATDPLADCTPGPKTDGGRSFSCDGFSVQWERSDGPSARADELFALKEERSAERLRLRSAARPLLDIYPLDGPRGPMVLWCTYPKRDGAAACADVARALRSAQQTGYWAPPVVEDG